MPSPLAVIQGDQGYGEHGPPLVMPNRQAQQQYAQPEGHDIPSAEVHDHRQQHAPDAIVHMKAGQEQWQLFANQVNSRSKPGSGKQGTGGFLVPGVLHGADQPHRQGKGH